MLSTVVKRSIVLNGRKTSVSMEQEFWEGLKSIARDRGVTVAKLAHEINSERGGHNLSSAIRLFVLKIHRERAKAPQSETPV
jgi:predicted DNA-binding ribbon-helix-helix protein